MPSFLTPAPVKIINKSSEVDYLKLEDMCSQMVHLSASEPLQVSQAVYLKLASSYFPAPKIENFSCAKKNSNRCKANAPSSIHAPRRRCTLRPRRATPRPSRSYSTGAWTCTPATPRTRPPWTSRRTTGTTTSWRSSRRPLRCASSGSVPSALCPAPKLACKLRIRSNGSNEHEHEHER